MRNFCLFFMPVTAALAVMIYLLISHLNAAVAKHSAEGPYSLTRFHTSDILISPDL